jgi:hypothetical protein
VSYRQRLQSRRFELKYIISEGTARSLRDFILPHVVPDAHAPPDNPIGYPIKSLYLDTPDLSLYQQTVRGIKNRFKLRIRFYHDEWDQPAYLEIKRRETDVIRKERAAIRRSRVPALLAGRRLIEDDLIADNGDGEKDLASVHAMHHFCRLRNRLTAAGTTYVCYFREAYVSPNDNSLRLTFDREVKGSPYDSSQGLRLPRDGRATAIGGVILEVKFTDQFPSWLHAMVQHFHLRRRSVPKYIESVNAVLRPNGTEKHRPNGALARVRERVR